MSVTKTDNDLVFTEGSNGTYTITVTNSGTTLTSSAMPVTVRDFLPQGFSYVSSSGVGWACSTASGIVTCSLGATTIAAGGNSQVTITVLPSAPAAANSPVTNSVQVFGGGDITQNNNFGQDTTNVNPAPAPVVDIAPPSKDFGGVGAGQTSAVQTFTLLNSGNADAERYRHQQDGDGCGAVQSATGAGVRCVYVSECLPVQFDGGGELHIWGESCARQARAGRAARIFRWRATRPPARIWWR